MNSLSISNFKLGKNIIYFYPKSSNKLTYFIVMNIIINRQVFSLDSEILYDSV